MPRTKTKHEIPPEWAVMPHLKDRGPVAHETWHCINAGCPGRTWADGTPRLQGRGHFTEDGTCRNRAG